MASLAYCLRQLCYKNRHGSHTTQKNRRNMLELFARQLKEGGYKLPQASSIKPKHVTHLVERWQTQDKLSVKTIKNRMAVLRWWSSAVNKASIIPRTNKELGIGRRTQTGNRSQDLDPKQLAKLKNPRYRLSLRLQVSFGLRLEESLKFRVSFADRGDHIAIKGTWAKGGRPRVIPITTKAQRDLLNEIHQTAGNGSMIADDKSYIQGLNDFKACCRQAGIKNIHGHRYHYAQTRYKQLAGFDCPYRGKDKQSLTAEQQRIDQQTRADVIEELGHGRSRETKTYLG